MSKRAWVLSGGGAGIIQMDELVRRHVAAGNPLPDFIVSSSAGTLLGTLYSRVGVEAARTQILQVRSRNDVFGSQFLAGVGKLGVWNSDPLMKRFKALPPNTSFPVYATCYDIESMGVRYFELVAPGWETFAIASASIPILVNPQGSLVDGGLTDNTPLAHAIDLGADVIEVFMCFARDTSYTDMPSNKIQMALRAYDAMRRRLVEKDLRVAADRNALARLQASGTSCGLSPYREIQAQVHYPARNYLDVLDFDQMQDVVQKMSLDKSYEQIVSIGDLS